MCGIVGIYKNSGINHEDLENLVKIIRLNIERGTKGFGILFPTKLVKSIEETSKVNWMLQLMPALGHKYVFVHMRSPTGENNENFYVTQPITYRDVIILHNGILLDYDRKLMSDTIYMAQKLSETDDIKKELANFKGTFTTVVLKGDSISLYRATNSMFIRQTKYSTLISSNEFDGSEEFRNNNYLELTTGENTIIDTYSPYDL